MEHEMKLIFGKILGEIYKTQKYQGICNYSDKRIFGLINGFEEEIDAEFENIKSYSKSEVSVVYDYLDPYYKDEKPLSDLNLLHFRMDIERQGISHERLIDILKYIRSHDGYSREIDHMGNFQLNERYF